MSARQDEIAVRAAYQALLSEGFDAVLRQVYRDNPIVWHHVIGLIATLHWVLGEDVPNNPVASFADMARQAVDHNPRRARSGPRAPDLPDWLFEDGGE
jgi:hypothetical protein